MRTGNDVRREEIILRIVSSFLEKTMMIRRRWNIYLFQDEQPIQQDYLFIIHRKFWLAWCFSSSFRVCSFSWKRKKNISKDYFHSDHVYNSTLVQFRRSLETLPLFTSNLFSFLHFPFIFYSHWLLLSSSSNSFFRTFLLLLL